MSPDPVSVLSAEEVRALRSALEWQIELGADEAICETPVDRYALEAKRSMATATTATATPATATAAIATSGGTPAAALPEPPDPVASARQVAATAGDLDGLRAALAAFEGSELKRGARNLVFADGASDARVMVLCDAPGREDDRAGRPFAGVDGVLLDAMFAAIGMSRAAGSLYVAPLVPWRPPQDRDPDDQEIALFAPFLERHVHLAAPRSVVLMGSAVCRAALGRGGVLALRGTWQEAFGRPALPIAPPSYLLRNPAAKAAAWADLLMLKGRLDTPAKEPM